MARINDAFDNYVAPKTFSKVEDNAAKNAAIDPSTRAKMDAARAASAASWTADLDLSFTISLKKNYTCTRFCTIWKT